MAYHITGDCTGCTLCARTCPVFAIEGERKTRHVINEARCVECGVCGRLCAFGAVQDAAGNTAQRVKRTDWPKPAINTDKCSACGICVDICTPGALGISSPVFQGDIDVFAELADAKKCVACGLCEDNCPLNAIEMCAVKVQEAKQ